MATRLIAEYLTPAGAVVTVQERTLLGLFDLTYAAHCSGCRGGTTEETGYTPAETAQARAMRWADRHAADCRRRS